MVEIDMNTRLGIIIYQSIDTNLLLPVRLRGIGDMKCGIASISLIVKRKVGAIADKLKWVLTAIQWPVFSKIARAVNVEYATVDVRENRHASILHLLNDRAKVRARREIADECVSLRIEIIATSLSTDWIFAVLYFIIKHRALD